MILSDFLGDMAEQRGANTLHASMVFLKLKRPIDDLIANALAIGPYHPGKPSPWSHCFLITEPYRGPQTAILDCTIRDRSGKVRWETTLHDDLQILAGALSKDGAGGIYSGKITDYDNEQRVSAFGLRWLPGLAAEERNKIVTMARGLQSEKYAYDLPGLLRELVRLMTGIAIPPADKRLFCSAFLQAAYRLGLPGVGDFNAGLVDADTTPDDIWYSPKGLGIANLNPHTEATSPVALSLFGAPASDPAVASSQPVTSDTNPVEVEIRRLLVKVKERGARNLPNGERVQGVLERALAQVQRASQGTVKGVDAIVHSDEYDLSIVQSAIAAPKEPTRLRSLFGRDIYDFHQYEQLDPKWIASLANQLTHSPLPFPVAPTVGDVVYPLAEKTTIAIAGDWGTGNASSRAIAAQMDVLKPDYTIHLGDVYYSGTESEEQSRFVDLWPSGKIASLALNSNHEMYSGGKGYFGVALSNAKFRQQRGFSYFALVNSTWMVIGLDSAYAASSSYQRGALNDAQIRWLRALLASDVGRIAGGPKNVILLTHHQGLELNGSRVDPLWSQVTDAIGNGLHRWYWGHVHGVAAFNPVEVAGTEMHARLVGHGGIPYAPDALNPALVWTETQTAGDPAIPQRGRNGFALLSFTEEGLQETFYDEFGNVRWNWP